MMAKQDSIGDYVAMYQVQPINSRQKQQHSSTGHNTQNTVISRAANGSITKNSSTKADSAFDMYSKTPQAYSGMNRGSNLEPGFSPDHSTNEKQGNFSSQLQAQVQSKQSRGGNRRAINLQNVYTVPDQIMDQAKVHSTVNANIENQNFKV